MRLKYGLSRENPVRELSTITDEKSPIGYNMKQLSESEILVKPDLPPGITLAEMTVIKKSTIKNGKTSGYKPR